MHESKQNSHGDEVESDIGNEFAAVELELGTSIPDLPLPMTETLVYDLSKDSELFIFPKEEIKEEKKG
jgi:hypothetical protein